MTRSKRLGDTYTKPSHLGGFTAFGAEVIQACNRLGIVIDLKHMSDDGVKWTLENSTQPVIFCHTGLLPGAGESSKIPNMAPRLLSRGELRDIDAGGGIIGIRCHGSDAARECVESIKRLVDVAGIDHVGIRTDSDDESDVQRTYTNAIWKGETRGFSPLLQRRC
jgi:membrane dipeptidase